MGERHTPTVPRFHHALSIALVLTSLSAFAEDPPPVEIVGNRVMPDAVYFAVLDLPPDPKIDAALVATVVKQIYDFLHAAGYELALVNASIDGGKIRVEIDEGQLEKIVFRGRLTVQSVRFKLGLDLPKDVFNRPSLEEQMVKLKRELQLPELRYELVPTEEVANQGPQLERLPSLKGMELVHGQRAWELHFVLPEREWDTGVGADLRIGYVDGIELGINNQGRGAFFTRDRWRVAAAVGAGLRFRVNDAGLYPAFSRLSGEGRYLSAPLFNVVRGFVSGQAELLNRQREDASLENYVAASLAAGAGIETEFRRGIRISTTVGYERRQLFAFQPALGAVLPEQVSPQVRPRAYVGLQLDLTFDPDKDRWDRHHQLLLDARAYLGFGAKPGLNKGWFRYQFLKEFGWHDLWINARGFGAWEEVTFHDESSVGELLHGAFTNVFVRRGISVGGVFSYSLTRDLLKAGVFADVAVYGRGDRVTGREDVQLAAAIGPSLHFLIEGLLQMDLYVAFALRTPDRGFSAAFSARIIKAY